MLTAFADWIEKGYRGLAERSGSPGSLISYRFWVGGPRGGSILCGVVKDSSDSVGRPYPLILMGMGPLADWESNWHQLPRAFEAAWVQLESISTRNYRDFKQMEADLRAVKSPAPEWKVFEDERNATVKPETEEAGTTEIPGLSTERADSAVLVLPVSGDRFGDSTGNLVRLHGMLKGRSPEIPKAVFMGGRPDRTLLAAFRRPLLAEDFGRLWLAFRNSGAQRENPQ
jgi:type VI secretion system protein VasJ